MTSRPALKFAKTTPVAGMTLLAFKGRGDNLRPFYGMEGQRYLFGGRNHLIGYVRDTDVEFMLQMREDGKPIFEEFKQIKVPAVKVKIAPKAPEPIPEPEPAPKKTRRKKTADA